jgi:hypothetical protein
MAKKELVSEKMTRDFSTFTLEPDGAEPELPEVRRRLQDAGHRFAVYVSEAAGGARMVVKLFDSAFGRFSDLKVGSQMRMGDLLATKEIMLAVSRDGMPGVAVVEAGEPVGVLIGEALVEEFTAPGFAVRTRSLGDWILKGEIKPGKPYRITCAKTGCNAVNVVVGFDPGRTLCVNGHVLEVLSK